MHLNAIELFQGTIILVILHAPQNSFNDKQKNDSCDSLNNIVKKLVEKYIRVTVGPEDHQYGGYNCGIMNITIRKTHFKK